ncbi:Homeodomain-like protein, partial [Dissophora ornata]
DEYSLAISRAMSLCPWSLIATRSIPGRTGVQAQARWSEALDPQVKKGPWSQEEDALLLSGVRESRKCWIWIADTIPGRTQRQCRTRW